METEQHSPDYVFGACEAKGGWLKGSSVESGVRPPTDGHVITVRKSMLLDLRPPHTFIILAAEQTDVEDA